MRWGFRAGMLGIRRGLVSILGGRREGKKGRREEKKGRREEKRGRRGSRMVERRVEWEGTGWWNGELGGSGGGNLVAIWSSVGNETGMMGVWDRRVM